MTASVDTVNGLEEEGGGSCRIAAASPATCDRALGERVDVSLATSGDVEGVNSSIPKTQANKQTLVNQCVSKESERMHTYPAWRCDPRAFVTNNYCPPFGINSC